MQLVHSAPAAPGSRSVIPRDRLIRLPEVMAVTGISKSTVYALMKKGKFPKCVFITGRMVAWPETAVLQWVQDCVQQAKAEAAQSVHTSALAMEGGAQ